MIFTHLDKKCLLAGPKTPPGSLGWSRGKASPRPGRASQRRGKASRRAGRASQRWGKASPRPKRAFRIAGNASPRPGSLGWRRGKASQRAGRASRRATDQQKWLNLASWRRFRSKSSKKAVFHLRPGWVAKMRQFWNLAGRAGNPLPVGCGVEAESRRGRKAAERRHDNSPAFQCRVKCRKYPKSRRDDRTNTNTITQAAAIFANEFQPSRWDLWPHASNPALKRRAIVGLSRWDDGWERVNPAKREDVIENLWFYK